MDDAETNSLALYGTLRRGAVNHWVLASLDGRWQAATIRGWLFDITWGAASGFPGFIADPSAPEVPVDVLTSSSLNSQLRRIDDFEGPGYRRSQIEASLGDGGSRWCWVYEALTHNEGSSPD